MNATTLLNIESAADSLAAARLRRRRQLADEWKQLRDGLRFAPQSAQYLRATLRRLATAKRESWASIHPLFSERAAIDCPWKKARFA